MSVRSILVAGLARPLGAHFLGDLAGGALGGAVKDLKDYLQGPVKVQDRGSASRPGKAKCTDDWRMVVAARGDVSVERGGEAEILGRRRARSAAVAA